MRKRKAKLNYRRIVLRLPDLDHSKMAVLNSLTSPGSRRVYQFALHQFITWYCSEPRLAFNRIVVVRYRMYLESRRLAANTINQQLAAVRRLAHGGCRCWVVESRSRSGDQSRQRREAARAALGQLAEPRAKLAGAEPRPRRPHAGETRLCHARLAFWLWTSPIRAGRVGDERCATTAGALGHRGFNRQGRAHSARSNGFFISFIQQTLGQI
jgi:hypothetical protein